MNEDTTRYFSRSYLDNGQPLTMPTDYKNVVRRGYTNAPVLNNTINKAARGGNSRSEGIITWHSQSPHLDLFSDAIALTEVQSPPVKTYPNRDDQLSSKNIINQTRISYNTQKPVEERDGREVLSPTPPKATRDEYNDCWQQPNSRVRHRKARNCTGPTPDPLGSQSPPTNTQTNTVSNSPYTNTNKSKTKSNMDLPTANSAPPSYLPPLSWKRTPSQSPAVASDTASDISDLDTTAITSTTSTKLPQVQLIPIWGDTDNNEPQEPTIDESTALVFTVIRQQHPKIEETLSNRLALLRNANILISRNGGWPNGIPFALEYLLAHGDVASLVDLAKIAYSISEDGGDDGDEREEMDAADYVWMAAWLGAVPVMIKSANPSHILVGLKVLAIVIPILEQWVETAIGIAHSLGPDAIPDDLREQCYKYNENCHKILPTVAGLERKGRVGVVANEVHHLLHAFLDKMLP